jgi:hypothetical protein
MNIFQDYVTLIAQKKYIRCNLKDKFSVKINKLVSVELLFHKNLRANNFHLSGT